MTDAVHIRPAPEGANCEVHDWPTEGLARRLVEAMRERHGKGGVSVCVDCVVRARDELGRRIGVRRA